MAFSQLLGMFHSRILTYLCVYVIVYQKTLRRSATGGEAAAKLCHKENKVERGNSTTTTTTTQAAAIQKGEER